MARIVAAIELAVSTGFPIHSGIEPPVEGRLNHAPNRLKVGGIRIRDHREQIPKGRGRIVASDHMPNRATQTERNSNEVDVMAQLNPKPSRLGRPAWHQETEHLLQTQTKLVNDGAVEEPATQCKGPRTLEPAVNIPVGHDRLFKARQSD